MQMNNTTMNDTVRAKIIKKRIPYDIRQLCESKEFQAVLAEPDNTSTILVKFENMGRYYKNQTHILEVKLGTSAHEYPFTAPNVKFLTPILHTNINIHGSICLSILKGKSIDNPEGWTEAYNLCSVIQSIFLLLECPNTASPFNSDASRLWTECKQGKLAEQYIASVDNYYFKNNYKAPLEMFENRYKEESPALENKLQELKIN